MNREQGEKSMRITSYQELQTWQQGMSLAEACYVLTRGFPKEELFGLIAQIRRASASISANIAEGWGRGGTREYVHFLRIAQGSLKELETHLLLAARVNLAAPAAIDPLLQSTALLGKLLLATLRTLKARLSPTL